MSSKQKQTPRAATSTPRGRPRAGEQALRRQAVLDVALAQLSECGYDKLSMLAIAQQAGASKETLYRWFGNRQGLFEALITRNADETQRQLQQALEGQQSPKGMLNAFSCALLRLLMSESSIALNRAAMASPELAALLLKAGRHRLGPMVESLLKELKERKTLQFEEASEAFTTLYGLVVRDSQIRVLLGEPAMSPAAIRRRAEQAVNAFLALHGAGSSDAVCGRP